MSIVGPTGSGKTFFVADLIRKRQEIISTPIEKVIYVYSDFQPIFYKLQAEDPNILFTNRIQDIEELTTDPCLIILDDQMDTLGRGKDNDLVTRFFIKHSHHRGASVALILQNAFKPGLREININTQYLVMYDQPRDRSTIRTLARQICPGQAQFLQDAYQKAVQDRDYGYLFIDLHPRNKKYKYWLRSHVFPIEECEVYSL